MVWSTQWQSFLLTQGNLLSGVSRQQENEECEGGDEDAGDEQVQSVVERPPPHHHGEGHVGVRLLTAVIETLVPPPGNLCKQNTNKQDLHAILTDRTHEAADCSSYTIFASDAAVLSDLRGLDSGKSEVYFKLCSDL